MLFLTDLSIFEVTFCFACDLNSFSRHFIKTTLTRKGKNLRNLIFFVIVQSLSDLLGQTSTLSSPQVKLFASRVQQRWIFLRATYKCCSSLSAEDSGVSDSGFRRTGRSPTSWNSSRRRRSRRKLKKKASHQLLPEMSRCYTFSQHYYNLTYLTIG